MLGALGWGLTQVAPYGVTGALIRQLMFANFVVAVFNLLPGLPLDGGRMLRAVIWKVTGRPGAATIAAAWVGRVLAHRRCSRSRSSPAAWPAATS